MSGIKDFIIGTFLAVGLVILSVIGFAAILAITAGVMLAVCSPIIIIVWLIVRSTH